jgi:hypothetical protein
VEHTAPAFALQCDFFTTRSSAKLFMMIHPFHLGCYWTWISSGPRKAGAKMERLGRIVHDIADGLRVSYHVSVMAVEFLAGVILMVATVAGSAATAAVWAPDLDIYSANDAGRKRPAAQSKLSSRLIADRRVVKKMFRICASLTVMWCALWTFIFSYGAPAGGAAAMLQVIIIPPAVLVLLIGLRLTFTDKQNVSGARQAAE